MSPPDQNELARDAESKAESKVLFLSPESIGEAFSFDHPSDAQEINQFKDWDLAVRYHEFKLMPSFQRVHQHVRSLSAKAILRRAQAVLGSVVRPMLPRTSALSELPPGESAEIDIEQTIEESPIALKHRKQLTAEDIWMGYAVPRGQPVVVAVDTSLSMTGEKLALTAVALSVVLLAFPGDPIGIVAFENEAKVLKRPDESITVFQLVERFLDVPAKGYTHLEDGLKGALRLLASIRQAGSSRPASALLLTDGKYTAGKDPAYLAPRFAHLEVIKMGREKASLSLCQELARRGHGQMKEVGDLEDLPGVMYSIVKQILRGKSAA